MCRSTVHLVEQAYDVVEPFCVIDDSVIDPVPWNASRLLLGNPRASHDRILYFF